MYFCCMPLLDGVGSRCFVLFELFALLHSAFPIRLCFTCCRLTLCVPFLSKRGVIVGVLIDALILS